MMSTMRAMADRHQAPSYPLRLPEDLKARVEESAKAQGRSLNAEIIARLQASFDDLAPAPTAKELRTLAEAINASLKNLEGVTAELKKATPSAPRRKRAPRDDDRVMFDDDEPAPIRPKAQPRVLHGPRGAAPKKR